MENANNSYRITARPDQHIGGAYSVEHNAYTKTLLFFCFLIIILPIFGL